MPKDIPEPFYFKALRATVTISSQADPRWNHYIERKGRNPPDVFSLRADVSNEGTEKLHEFLGILGPPPNDLLFKVEEEWSFS